MGRGFMWMVVSFLDARLLSKWASFPSVSLIRDGKILTMGYLEAFGIFARVLDDTQEFKTLRRWSEGIELADSITVDGHKMLNVVSIPHLFLIYTYICSTCLLTA